MKYSKKPGRKRFTRKFRSANGDEEKIVQAKNPETKIEILMRLQGSKNPEITRSLVTNSALPLSERFSMALKYLDYPTKDVAHSKKFDVIENIRKEALDVNQISKIVDYKKNLQRSYSNILMNSFTPNVPSLQKILENQYPAMLRKIEELDINIPVTFTKRLKRPWVICLIFAVHYGSEKTFLRSENFKEKNATWLKGLASNHPTLEVDNLNVDSILDFQTPLFQQAIMLLLVTHNFGVIFQLIESVKESAALFVSKSAEQEELVSNKRISVRNQFESNTTNINLQNTVVSIAMAQAELAKIKMETLANLSSQLFLESRDADGYLDNGYSWGISKNSIFELYHSKVNARIIFASRDIRSEVNSIFDNDDTHIEFQEFIGNLDCMDYRGNLRRYSAFPRDYFDEIAFSIEEAKFLYEEWSRKYLNSVLSATRGHIPKNVQDFLLGWNQISRLINESEIYLCKSVGLVCNYQNFDLVIHVAFVASIPTSDGLRGQWLILVSGLADQYSRDMQVMGWQNLFDTSFQYQEKFSLLRNYGNNFWLYQHTDAKRVKGEIGKLIEGLLFEKYGMTASNSTAYVKEFSPEIRRERREVLDLIFRIRRYRESRRFRPYQGYCANPECGLPLSDPISLARGFGPICWDKMYKEGVRHRDLVTDYDRLYYETPDSLLAWQEACVFFFQQQLAGMRAK